MAIKHFRDPLSRNIVWLFCAFYGFTMVVNSSGQDAARYIEKLEIMHNASPTIGEFVDVLYSENGNSRIADVIQPTITYIVSIFTDSGRVLYLIFGLVFGYFYSRNIWYLIDLYKAPFSLASTLILLSFAMLVGVWEVNGFRFWTAAHVFFLGVIPYLLEGSNKNRWCLLLAPLMHFAYFFPVLLFLTYRVVGNKIYLYTFFMLITFFISELDISILREATNFLPQIFKSRFDGYLNETVVENFKAAEITYNWYIVWSSKLLRYTLVFLSLFLVTQNKFLYKGVRSGLCFSLFFLGVSNLSAMLPSGGRYITLANLFVLATVFIYLQGYNRETNKIKKIIVYALPVWGLFLIVAGRYLTENQGVLGLFGNPLMALFGNVDIAIIELIKGI